MRPRGCLHLPFRAAPRRPVPSQAALDSLDAGIRLVDYKGKDWGDVEDGGAAKPSRLIAYAEEAASAAK